MVHGLSIEYDGHIISRKALLYKEFDKDSAGISGRKSKVGNRCCEHSLARSKNERDIGLHTQRRIFCMSDSIASDQVSNNYAFTFSSLLMIDC